MSFKSIVRELKEMRDGIGSISRRGGGGEGPRGGAGPLAAAAEVLGPSICPPPPPPPRGEGERGAPPGEVGQPPAGAPIGCDTKIGGERGSVAREAPPRRLRGRLPVVARFDKGGCEDIGGMRPDHLPNFA
uniref:Uncharacterized protein n=1 Tax=Ananas comosus var. bracteatus TaxID=296719 RepID=A0A6V7QIT3_ANACO|nr:unnamed protein product [Ananas comosus var. bracteatus]